MATLSYEQSKAVGEELTMAAASAGGDKVAPNPRGAVLVRNGDASSKTVTVDVPGNDKYGSARPNIAFAVPAGAIASLGPFPADLAGDDGLVALTYSAVTNVFVGAVQI